MTLGAATNPQFSSDHVPQRQKTSSGVPFHERDTSKPIVDDGILSRIGQETSKNGTTTDTPLTDDDSTVLDAASPTESSDAGSSDKEVPSIERDSPEGAFRVAKHPLFVESPQNDHAAVASPSTQGLESSLDSPDSALQTPLYVDQERNGGSPDASVLHSSMSRGRSSEQQQDDSVSYTSPHVGRDTPEGAMRVVQNALFSGSLAPDASVKPSNFQVDTSSSGFNDLGPDDDHDIVEAFEDANDPSLDNQENELIEPSSQGVDPGLPFNEVVADNSNDSVSALLEPARKETRKTSAKKRRHQPLSLLEAATVSNAPDTRTRTRPPASSPNGSPINHKRHRGKRKGFSDRCYRGQLCFFQRLFMPEGQLQYAGVGCPCQACRAGKGHCQARGGAASEPRRKKRRRRVS